MLASITAPSVTSEKKPGSAWNRHSLRRINPTNKPAHANNSATCGPEFPSAIGSGGVNSAQIRNSINQRFGTLRMRHAKGIAMSGADSTTFVLSEGASATAVAYNPRPIPSRASLESRVLFFFKQKTAYEI